MPAEKCKLNSKCREKDIIKIKIINNKIVNRQTKDKINESKILFYEKFHQLMNIYLDRLCNKKEVMQMAHILDKGGHITVDPIAILGKKENINNLMQYSHLRDTFSLRDYKLLKLT